VAKAIKRIELNQQSAEEEQQEDLKAILQQIADSRQTIQDSLKIMQELQESGLLDIVKGLLSKRVEVAKIAMQQLNQPGAHHLIKSGFALVGLLSAIEPAQIQRLFDGMAKGIEQAAEGPGEKKALSTWGLLKALKDPNISASIQMLLQFLEGMGSSLNESPNKEATS